MVWKEVVDKAKELGERVSGKGPEVDFRHEIDEAVARGIPKPRAEKETFLDRVDQIEDEIRYTGCMDSKSKHWRGFEAAMNELFSDTEKERFLADAGTPIFRNIALTPATSAEYNKAKSYFGGKFGGETPSVGVIRDMAQNAKLLREVNARIFGDVSPHAASGVDLRAILATHPEMGADIGMAQMIKDQMIQSEQRFGREVAHKQEWERYKEDASGSLNEIFYKIPCQFLKNFGKNTIKIMKSKNMAEAFMGAVVSSSVDAAIGTAKVGFEGAKLAYGGAKTLALYLNKQLR
jgi:hypothetical protein